MRVAGSEISQTEVRCRRRVRNTASSVSLLLAEGNDAAGKHYGVTADRPNATINSSCGGGHSDE